MENMMERYKFISRVASITNDPEDELEAINSAAKLGFGLTAEERNALDSGFQKLIEAKIARWRMVKKFQHHIDQHFDALAEEYLQRVGDEIAEMCNKILLTVHNYLLPTSKTRESDVFYHKMKGDYCSCLAEVKSHADRREATSQSLEAYEAATVIAKSALTPTDPIRLRLALNFSQFLYEIMDNTEWAHNMAAQASKDAAAELDSLDDKSQQECSLIMRTIEKNLALWTPDPGEEDDLRPPPPSHPNGFLK